MAGIGRLRVSRRTVCLWLGTLLATGCRRGSRRIVLRLGHSLAVSHPVHRALEQMGVELEQRSQGRLWLKIYPNSQLGSEREMIELVQLGALDMVKTSTAPLEGFVPSMSVFGIPYLFSDETHYWKILEGRIGLQLLRAGEPKKLMGLCYYDAGSRSFYTKPRPVVRPKDLLGLKIRVQNSPTAFEMVKMMGGSPTPISFAELYTALQEGVVDGAENNPPSFVASRHYEVCPYYSLDEHTRVPDVVLIATERWRRLDTVAQQWLREAGKVSSRFQRKLWAQRTQAALDTVKAAGVQVINPDKRPFQEAVAPMVAQYKKTNLRRLIEAIQQAA